MLEVRTPGLSQLASRFRDRDAGVKVAEPPLSVG